MLSMPIGVFMSPYYYCCWLSIREVTVAPSSSSLPTNHLNCRSSPHSFDHLKNSSGCSCPLELLSRFIAAKMCSMPSYVCKYVICRSTLCLSHGVWLKRNDVVVKSWHFQAAIYSIMVFYDFRQEIQLDSTITAFSLFQFKR